MCCLTTFVNMSMCDAYRACEGSGKNTCVLVYLPVDIDPLSEEEGETIADWDHYLGNWAKNGSAFVSAGKIAIHELFPELETSSQDQVTVFYQRGKPALVYEKEFFMEGYSMLVDQYFKNGKFLEDYTDPQLKVMPLKPFPAACPD